MEMWKVCDNPRYAVSNMGDVRNVRTGRPKRQFLASTGYWLVSMAQGRQVTHPAFVHRLVAAAFIGPCPKGETVNHVDGDKRNNTATNLEYLTRRGNVRHAKRMGLCPRGEHNGTSKLSNKDVRQIRQLYAPGRVTQQALATRFGVSQSLIYLVLLRRVWTHV